MGVLGQFIGGERHGGIGAAGGGIDDGKALKGAVQVDGGLRIGQGKGAHAADGVTGKGYHLFGGEHFGLGVELGFEFGIVDLGIAGGHDEHALLIHQEGEGLGDAFRRTAHSLGGQFHGGAGDVKFPDAVFHTSGTEEGPDLFDGHLSGLPFSFRSWPGSGPR